MKFHTNTVHSENTRNGSNYQNKAGLSWRYMGKKTTIILNLKLLAETSVTIKRFASRENTLTSACKLHLTHKETQVLRRWVNAEKTTSSSSRRQSSFTQMKLVSCITATSTQRFLIERIPLPLKSQAFTLTRLRSIRTYYIVWRIQCPPQAGNDRI